MPSKKRNVPSRSRGETPFEALYRETQNPAYAWLAFLDARHEGIAIPESVLEYLERCAHRVMTLSHWGKQSSSVQEKYEDGRVSFRLYGRVPGKGEVSDAIAEAFEFKKPGRRGNQNSLRSVYDRLHEQSIAAAVWLKILEGQQPTYACDDVAKEHPLKCDQNPRCKSISSPTIKRCWKKHARLFPPIAEVK